LRCESCVAFQQGEAGYLGCDASYPGSARGTRSARDLRYSEGQLVLTDFALAPIVAVNRLQLDLSGSEQEDFA
jgi:hypothetical protein